ncbi:GNAT family N-acetyltransferase [Alicyclobacillus tolerans]|uniref:RimJ/RimL family protein N-acetyltransferase n=1 Tax=Alicyclobacillus tolerans TaxID=90970 RepID=A0ABT9LU93_9BACL|nr:GNAT family N-acetyltransferase [Alicyclobacillus tengchongensis]MDP9727824.1 RimJ/RimL family protein N-acetyltransferase [Alicyclobacillus tengchongensis]
MGIKFRTINIELDSDNFIKFRKDSFRVSFGHEDDFNEQEYIDLIQKRTKEFPEGYVFVELDGEVIGQIEVHPREFDGRRIGFVSLFYLIPEFRGKGFGEQLKNYVEDLLFRNGITEYHLRVSPTNVNAIRFYEKCGLLKIQEEHHQHIMWRMGKVISETNT